MYGIVCQILSVLKVCKLLSVGSVTNVDLTKLHKVFLRATAGTAIARLSHRNSVRLSVRPSVRHTGGTGKNGAI